MFSCSAPVLALAPCTAGLLRRRIFLAGAPSLPRPDPGTGKRSCWPGMAAGDAAARDDLITHNLRLVVYLAKKYEKQRCACRGHDQHWHHRAHQGGEHLPGGAQHQAGHIRQPLHRQRDPDVPAQKFQPPAGGQHRRAFERGRRRQRAAAFGYSGQ